MEKEPRLAEDIVEPLENLTRIPGETTDAEGAHYDKTAPSMGRRPRAEPPNQRTFHASGNRASLTK
jgi:hypothetical protein